MKYDKPPLTTPQIIDRLKARGLVITDEPEAINHIDNIGFYRLSAYFMPFEQARVNHHSRNHFFLTNTQFEDIVHLYVFDRKLRLIIMEAIERIEVAVRTQWTNRLAQSTQNAHAYMDSTNFRNPWEHQKELSRISQDLKESSETFIQHYRGRYQEPYLPPIWAMVETLTMGQLSKWVANTKDNHLKKQIAKALGLPTVEIFESAMQCISLIRNICAHHGRLWDRPQVKRLPYIKKLHTLMCFHEVKVIKENGDTAVQKHPSNELYNYLVILCFIMRTLQPTSRWFSRLLAHIHTIPEKQQQRMGFPTNWQENAFFQEGEA